MSGEGGGGGGGGGEGDGEGEGEGRGSGRGRVSVREGGGWTYLLTGRGEQRRGTGSKGAGQSGQLHEGSQ